MDVSVEKENVMSHVNGSHGTNDDNIEENNVKSTSSQSSNGTTTTTTTSSAAPPMSSAPSDSSSELVAAAAAALSASDLSVASDLYSRALSIVCAESGDLSAAAAPLYYAYGDALLRSYVAASDALGDVAKEQQTHNPIGRGHGGIIGEDDVDDTDGADSPTARAETNDEGKSAESSDSDDLAAAWEALELARVIYSREYDEASGTPHHIGVALADTLERIADLSMESEQFATAHDDYISALRLRESLLPDQHRIIAGTHSNIAVTLIFSKDIANAVRHYIQARELLKRHVLHLYQQAFNLVGDTDDQRFAAVLRNVDAYKDVAENIADLAAVIVELDERITDLQEEIANPRAIPTHDIPTPHNDAANAYSAPPAMSNASSFTSAPFVIPQLTFSVGSSLANSTTNDAAIATTSAKRKNSAADETAHEAPVKRKRVE